MLPETPSSSQLLNAVNAIVGPIGSMFPLVFGFVLAGIMASTLFRMSKRTGRLMHEILDTPADNAFPTPRPNPISHMDHPNQAIPHHEKLPRKCPSCGAPTIETFHGKDNREACIYCGTVLSE